MTLQLIFTMVLFFSILGMLLWTYFENRKLSNNHNENINSLEKEISFNNFQMNLRNISLKRYDFLRFNIDEALIIQKEIILM